MPEIRMVERFERRGGLVASTRRIALLRLAGWIVLLAGFGWFAGDRIAGRNAAKAVTIGVVVAGGLQFLVARATLAVAPREPESRGGDLAAEGATALPPNETPVAMLQALATGAAIRMFGGVIAVVLVLKLGRVDPLPFLAGFGGTYLALEIALARALIELERALRPRERGREGAGW